MFSPTKKINKRKTAGFSLVELVVSVAILVVITGVVLVKHASFGGSVLIGNLAYDVALSIRQAQVFGLSVREFIVGSGQFDVGYGVHFDIDNPTDYRIFADIDKGKTYNAGDGTEEIYNISQGYAVQQICATNVANVELCSGVDNINTLDIVFIRPEPDAYIRINGDPMTIYQSARVIVRSPQGATRQVTVESTGQISISQD